MLPGVRQPIACLYPRARCALLKATGNVPSARKEIGGGCENRTHDRSFADSRLTTWLTRPQITLKIARAAVGSYCKKLLTRGPDIPRLCAYMSPSFKRLSTLIPVFNEVRTIEEL